MCLIIDIHAEGIIQTETTKRLSPMRSAENILDLMLDRAKHALDQVCGSTVGEHGAGQHVAKSVFDALDQLAEEDESQNDVFVRDLLGEPAMADIDRPYVVAVDGNHLEIVEAQFFQDVGVA